MYAPVHGMYTVYTHGLRHNTHARRHLELLLLDCQKLIREDGLRSWQQLEAQHQHQHQDKRAAPASSGAGPSADGSDDGNSVRGIGGSGSGSAGPDLSVLLAYVASSAHQLQGLRPSALRMSDVPVIHAEYKRLLAARY